MSHPLRTVAAICSLLAAGFSFAATPAQAASATIYVVSGVYDSGSGSNAGVATSFHCTNLDRAQNTVTVTVHDTIGAVAGGGPTTLSRRQSVTVSTHFTTLFADASLSSGQVTQGYAVIAATSSNLVCSEMIVDASASVPNGIALHMQRRTPLANTQE
jgi:hypothetical protein